MVTPRFAFLLQMYTGSKYWLSGSSITNNRYRISPEKNHIGRSLSEIHTFQWSSCINHINNKGRSKLNQNSFILQALQKNTNIFLLLEKVPKWLNNMRETDFNYMANKYTEVHSCLQS